MQRDLSGASSQYKMALSQAPAPRSQEGRLGELTTPGGTDQGAESQGSNGPLCLGMSRKLAHPPQPWPAWAEAAASPVTLQMAEDRTAQALGAERQVEKPKECGTRHQEAGAHALLLYSQLLRQAPHLPEPCHPTRGVVTNRLHTLGKFGDGEKEDALHRTLQGGSWVSTGTLPPAEERRAPGRHGECSQGHPQRHEPNKQPHWPRLKTICSVIANLLWTPVEPPQRQARLGNLLLGYEGQVSRFLKIPAFQPPGSLPCHILQGPREAEEPSEPSLQLGTMTASCASKILQGFDSLGTSGHSPKDPASAKLCVHPSGLSPGVCVCVQLWAEMWLPTSHH